MFGYLIKDYFASFFLISIDQKEAPTHKIFYYVLNLAKAKGLVRIKIFRVQFVYDD